MITFTIGTVTYQAEEGMTWEEWCNSEYNTDGYYAYNTTGTNPLITNDAGIVMYNGAKAKPNDVIIDGYKYGKQFSGGSDN